MLPVGKHVDSVYFSPETGLNNHISKGSIVIDFSTIDAKTSRNVAAALAKQGIYFVDAPVSSGVIAGTLNIMVRVK